MIRLALPALAGTRRLFKRSATRRLALILGAAALVLPLVSGCSMFRAQVGYGLGLGVDVQLPALIHTGLAAGEFTHVGPLYGRQMRTRRELALTAVAWHYEGDRKVIEDSWFPSGQLRARHACWAGAPPLTTYDGDDFGTGVMPWSFELGIMLIAVDLRVGWNPVAPFR